MAAVVVVVALTVAAADTANQRVRSLQKSRAEEQSSALPFYLPANRNTIPAIRSNAPGFANALALALIAARLGASLNNSTSARSSDSSVTSRCNNITAAPASTSTSAFFR
jgi:hypothetical protein